MPNKGESSLLTSPKPTMGDGEELSAEERGEVDVEGASGGLGYGDPKGDEALDDKASDNGNPSFDDIKSQGLPEGVISSSSIFGMFSNKATEAMSSRFNSLKSGFSGYLEQWKSDDASEESSESPDTTAKIEHCNLYRFVTATNWNEVCVEKGDSIAGMRYVNVSGDPWAERGYNHYKCLGCDKIFSDKTKIYSHGEEFGGSTSTGSP